MRKILIRFYKLHCDREFQVRPDGSYSICQATAGHDPEWSAPDSTCMEAGFFREPLVFCRFCLHRLWSCLFWSMSVAGKLSIGLILAISDIMSTQMSKKRKVAMTLTKKILEHGKLLGQRWLTKKFYCKYGFIGFDWCFQRSKSLFGALHRGGGPSE